MPCLSRSAFFAGFSAGSRISDFAVAATVVACLEQLSEPLITSKLASELLVSLHSLSSDDVKQYVVKCRLEQLPEQNQSEQSMPGAQASITGRQQPLLS